MADPVIFHATTRAEWHAAQNAGTYTADSLATEGFIHCSERRQVIWVANTRFRGRLDLVLLHIDVAKLRSKVVYENLEGGTEMFPHVYGPLNLDAVLTVVPFLPAADGTFVPSAIDG